MRGIALLWLRIALAVLFARHTASAWVGGRPSIAALGFGVAALFFLAGLFTPVLSLVSAALEMYASYPLNAIAWPVPFLAISVLLALAALGPGAYSLDALFFGRKKFTIGHSSS